MYENQNYRPRANAFLSGLLGFMTFIFMCVFIPLLALRPMNVGNMVRHSDVSLVLEETGMSYEIVETLNELDFLENEIDVRNVEIFLSSPAVSNEIGRVMDDYARAIARGDLDHHLTSADLVDIARNLEPEVSDMLDHQMTEADFRELAEVLDDMIEFSDLRAEYILEDLDVEVPVQVLFVSVYLVWGVGILCAATVLLIFVHHRRWIADGFRAAGVPIMLPGFLFFMIGLMFNLYPQILEEWLYEMAAFIAGPAYLLMMYGAAFAALGVLSSIIGFILNRRA